MIRLEIVNETEYYLSIGFHSGMYDLHYDIVYSNHLQHIKVSALLKGSYRYRHLIISLRLIQGR